MKGGFFFTPQTLTGTVPTYPKRIPSMSIKDRMHTGKKKTNVKKPKPSEPKVSKAQMRDILRGLHIPPMPKYKANVNRNPMMY